MPAKNTKSRIKWRKGRLGSRLPQLPEHHIDDRQIRPAQRRCRPCWCRRLIPRKEQASRPLLTRQSVNGQRGDLRSLVLQELIENRLDRSKKIIPVFITDRSCLRQVHCSRIAVYAIQSIFVMQMVCGGEACSSDVANCLSLYNPPIDACFSVKRRHVRIKCRNVSTMLKNHNIAITILDGSKNNLAVACCLDRRASRRSIIDTTMRPYCIQNRMFSIRIEA